LAAACALLAHASAFAEGAMAPAAQAQPDDATEAQAIQIVGRRQSGQYHEGRSDGATKTDTPLIEVPQAVRVVPRQLLDDLGALRVDDVLDYVAGVSRQNNFGGTWDNVAMRGFAGHEDTGMSLLRNGMAANRGFNAPRDTANLERLEFLKGTMGALYGSSEPGGTVNLVTKQPRSTAGHSVEAYYGSYDTKRLALDSTGPLNGGEGEPATLAYRLNVSVEDKGSFRDDVHSRRQLVAPALAWRFSPDTTIRYDGEWLRQQAPLDRGIVSVNGRLDAVPVSRFYGEPTDGDITIDNQTHQLFVDHELGNDWRLHGGLQYKRGTLAGLASEGHQYGPAPCPTSVDSEGWLCRRLRERDFVSDETSLQLELNGRLSLGGLQHELLAGAEWAQYRMDQRLMQQAGGERYSYGISVFDPVYGAARPALTVAAMNRTLNDRSTAVYLQDHIDLAAQWKLLAGVRFDRYDGEIDDRNARRTTQDPSATSPRLGLTWLAQPNWSVYASVGRSFRPQTNTDAAGNTLAAETGTAAEIGSKWQSADGRLGASVALFDIAKQHRTTYDADGIYLVTVPGTVRNRGAEFEMSGWVLPGWRVALAYAYLDTDKTITQFARHSGSAFVVHEMSLAGAGLVGLGGGVTHVGERFGDTGEPRLPGYTVAKLTAYWSATPQLRLSLDIDNLFDRTYYASAYNRVWITPGSPRSAVAGVQYKF
jgi:iron complex outermembrane recepter protein